MAATLPALKSLDEFLQVSYDYIIVGGGNTGLPVAARLSEDPNIKVAVIEAGGAKLGDPLVLTPAAFPSLIGNEEYDWKFTTVPQAGTNSIEHSWPRGKLLGGSSAINYMMYGRGQVSEYDDWEKLIGLKGWGWKDILPYFLKHEDFNETKESSDIRQSDFAFEKKHHGSGGPIKTSFATFRSPVETDYHAAAENAAIPRSRDAWSGDHRGIYANLATVDRSGPGTRSYAVTGYLEPYGQRPNLAVLTNALVEKVIFKEGAPVPIVEGVIFSFENKPYKLTSKIATILSAGAVMTPKILELSGIGPKSILSKLNIDCIVDNPRIGEVEDHIFTGLTYDLNDGEFSLDQLNIPELKNKEIEKYAGGRPSPMANAVSNSGFLSLKDVASPEEMEEVSRIIVVHKETLTTDLDRNRSDILLARLQDPDAAIFQLIALAANINFGGRHYTQELIPVSPDTSRFSIVVALHQCLSRGTIHITSSDPAKQPAIDPQILGHPVDELILAYALRFVQNKIVNTSPLKDRLKQRVLPAPEVDLDNLEDALPYIRSHTGTEFHPIASASLGTVVDGNLNVKGVKGLKVCDASIIPLHISGNIQCLCYAIGERGADLIKDAQAAVGE